MQSGDPGLHIHIIVHGYKYAGDLSIAFMQPSGVLLRIECYSALGGNRYPPSAKWSAHLGLHDRDNFRHVCTRILYLLP